MTREELFDILRPIVIAKTGVTECILADPNATAPSGEYAAIEPFSNISEVGTGGTYTETVDAEDGSDYQDIEVTIRSSQEVTVSVNFYRGNARDYAPKLMQADKFPSTQETMLINGLGWMRTSEVNNLTSLNQGQQEPRAQLYIYLRRMESMSETVQQIYTVETQGADEYGTVQVDNTLTVGSLGIFDLEKSMQAYANSTKKTYQYVLLNQEADEVTDAADEYAEVVGMIHEDYFG